MKFESINPFNGEVIASYNEMNMDEVHILINKMQSAYKQWRKTTIKERSELMLKVAENLKQNVNEYAKTITLEVGKPIRESKAEVLKCASVCEYYANHTFAFLQKENIETDASESYVQYDPMGIVFAIMPWNFPFWQVFRFASPALMAGNAALLKHAPNVFGSAQLIENIFQEAGFPKNIFRQLLIHHDNTESIIAHPHIKAVTLTGSERAGQSVAMLAGKYLKKVVLELGGSNAFIVLKDADKEKTIKTALTARMLNSGQSCIAAKRLIVVPEAVDWFVSGLVDAVKQLKSGDPILEETQVGPLARRDLAEQLHQQMNQSIDQGAKLLCGGKMI
ncbi:MAG TPA: aldehyde dehydrogenase family protein, partial [Bacteroidia bacterium]|nr:aldehyde dehydrogenase family protein [Bacteroidia bacterium]